MTDFKDFFSQQANIYRNSRPTYPHALYEFVILHCKNRNMAWDCATGNGQCATALADYFAKVIATDASASQIENAILHPKITYGVATAYNSGLENASADLVTVATAAHWFQIEKFYEEAERVLKPGGVLSIWSYGGCRPADEKINAILQEFSMEVLKDYWAPEIWQIWRDKYKYLPFPYTQLHAPQFKTQLYWNVSQFIAYLNSWSGVQNYKNHTGQNPVSIIESQLRNAWKNEKETKLLTWDLYMKTGIKP